MATPSAANLAGEYCRAGLACFEHARVSKWQDKEMLERTGHCLVRAINLDSHCLEAYLGLAMLAAVIGHFERALKVLQQARQCFPKDPRIPVLLREITPMFRLGGAQPQALNVGELIARVDFGRVDSHAMRALDAELFASLSFARGGV